MWVLVNNNGFKVFSNPEGFIFKGIQYPSNVFEIWSIEELNNVGIWDLIPFIYNTNTHVLTTKINFVKVNNHYEEQATIIFKSIIELQKLRRNDISEFNSDKKEMGIIINGFEIETTTNARVDLSLVGVYVLSQNSLPPDFKWLTLNQGLVGINLVQFKILFEAVGKHIIDCNIAADIHIQAINLLTDGQQIIDYDITTGWPSTLK